MTALSASRATGQAGLNETLIVASFPTEDASCDERLPTAKYDCASSRPQPVWSEPVDAVETDECDRELSAEKTEDDEEEADEARVEE